MPVNRRDFLAASGWALAAGIADAGPPGEAAAGAGDLSSWAAVRAQFNLSPEWLHFSQFFIVSHPRPVREAIERYRRLLDASPFETVEHGMGFDAPPAGASAADTLPLRAQRAAAEYIGGRAEEVALTDCTTTGLALTYNGLALKAGDEILATSHEHFVHHEAIRLACERSGASSRRVSLYDAPQTASVDEMAERLRRAIGPRTRVVALTWVHSSSGVKLPIQTLAGVVREANRNRDAADRALLVLDAVHGFGNQDLDLAASGADFAAAGTHKWIFAPRGTGILWAPARNWPLLRPTIPSFCAPEVFAAWEDGRSPGATAQASWVSPGGFKAYEHQWAMADAFRFHRQIGRRRIAERIAALNTLCKDGLARIPGVTVLTPRDAGLSAGIICFEIAGRSPQAIVAGLRERRVVASTSPYRQSVARLAPSLVNDEREVEAALRAVRAIA
ncbi:MAG TPA: aminotransferase class V-fold PLP-dependent enzyme [Steroidobacteraceae bacterium]|nr:aminotransferase class V-fold PLP-dependent enzyme [Steroidobacteraceae bacterium]